MRFRRRNDPTLAGCAIMLVFVLTSIGGWITHVIHCIQSEQWILLVAGALAAPIGVIHGIGLWFGVF